MPKLTQEQKDMLEGLKKRKKEGKKVKQIDNGSLYAGSPMYYYCRLCGLLAATLPETHTCAAPKHCGPCKEMIAAGYDPSEGGFKTTVIVRE